MGQVAGSLYRTLCCKEIVKHDVNTDYATYGCEGDVDYVTNQNPYYEHDHDYDYDNMESSAGQKGRPHARVRASYVEIFVKD